MNTEFKTLSRKWPTEGSGLQNSTHQEKGQQKAAESKIQGNNRETSQHSKLHFTCTVQTGLRFAVKMVVHVETRPPLEQNGKDTANPPGDQNELLLGGRMT